MHLNLKMEAKHYSMKKTVTKLASYRCRIQFRNTSKLVDLLRLCFSIPMIKDVSEKNARLGFEFLYCSRLAT